MLFQTPQFFVFFAVVMLFYTASLRHLRMQNAIVMVASYVFYAVWDLRFLSLIITATTVAYIAGISASGTRIEKRQLRDALLFLAAGSLISFGPGLPDTGAYLACCAGLGIAIAGFSAWANGVSAERRQQASVVAGVVFNLALLGFFKYFNFFADSLADLARSVGTDLGYVTLKVVLPVGISFFTFQKLAYIIDIKRGRVTAATDLIKFGAFVAYFSAIGGGADRARRASDVAVRPAAPHHVRRGFNRGSTVFVVHV